MLAKRGEEKMSEARPKLFVRRFVAQWDYPTFAEWLRVHGREEVPVCALPFVGFVCCEHAEVKAVGDGPADVRRTALAAEPSANVGARSDRDRASQGRLVMGFGYQDGRVGAVAWLTSRPGLGPKTVLTACSLVTGAVERELEARGVRLMISPTERPSLVKFMRRRGWRVAHAANVLLYKTLERASADADDCAEPRRKGGKSL